jgi:hypothetical protein
MQPKNLILGVIGIVALVAAYGSAQHRDPNASILAMPDFDNRIKAYAALRDKLEKGDAALDETSKPEQIVAAQQALAAKIKAARSTAKRGDIFTPGIQAQFKRLLNPEMKGTGGQNTRGIIKDEGPGRGGFPLAVNLAYPREQPFGTVPANILSALPPLPEHIEYRFVDRHLILRDTRANLIIDFLPNAIPRT